MMRAFSTLTGLVAPLDRANIDTDAILPKQFLKSIRRTGFGPYLFDEWRYLDRGESGVDCGTRPLNPTFELNQERFRDATILLARDNFGCGSSREHAVWALDGYGIRALIAPSFADIFYTNCLRNGLLPVVLGVTETDRLFEAVRNSPGYQLTVDLTAQHVVTPDGRLLHFAIDAFRKGCLLQNLDDIELTLQHSNDIRSYESVRYQTEPWIFDRNGL
jgi:3-isopropylmalate/(R)-2-methylmalate dehydratase small subunit